MIGNDSLYNRLSLRNGSVLLPGGIEWIVPRQLTANKFEELVNEYEKKLGVNEEQDNAQP